MPVVTVNGLVKHFRLPEGDVVSAVNDVSFSISEGETLGLVGESGSGKTTVGRCLLRLIEPNHGSIIFLGQDLTTLGRKQLRLVRPQMQMIFQETLESLNPRKKVGDIVAEPLVLWRKMLRADRLENVESLLSTVGLSKGLMDAYPHQLTGGEQQRVGIARAIALSPRLLVLDEPTSALDPTTHAEIMELLKDLQEKFGFAYLFISHDLAAVRRISHAVAIMYLSRIVEVAPTESLFQTPQHPYTRSLLSSVLSTDPRARHRVFVLKGEIPSPINLPHGCYFYSRCPVRLPDQCPKEFPPLVDSGSRHFAACYNLAGAKTFFEAEPEAEPIRREMPDGS